MSDSGKYRRLLKNTAVFMVGNMGSKLIAFFIVPFYTYVLSTEEYGIADLITTTVNLVTPFAMLGMNEAMLRFTAAREDDTSSLASDSLLIVFSGMVVSWLLFPLLSGISIIGTQIALFLALLNLQAFNHVFLQLLRGMGKTASYAFNGVLTTFVMASANVVALAVLHLGVAGYLISMIVAQAVGAAHIVLSSRLWTLISFRAVDKKLLSRMLHYCIPLIPNSLMWWIMSASDRYVILLFMDAGSNGLYNVAQKVPTIVNMVYAIFMQAWQISVIEERDSEDRALFQSTVFRYIFVVLAAVSSLIAASAHPLYAFLMSAAYEGSWQPVAMLSMANLFYCIAAFFGTTYAATKETKKAFSTTAIGAIVNIVLTVVLVPLVGIMGAAAATAVSYVVLVFARKRDMDAFARLEYRKAEVAPALVIILAQVVISFFPYHPALLATNFALFGVLLVVLRGSLFGMARMGSRAIKERFVGRRG